MPDFWRLDNEGVTLLLPHCTYRARPECSNALADVNRDPPGGVLSDQFLCQFQCINRLESLRPRTPHAPPSRRRTAVQQALDRSLRHCLPTMGSSK